MPIPPVADTAAPSQASPIAVTLSQLVGRAGEVLGTSPWHTISQDDVDAFARLTGDEQWIHIDPERAAAGPFGGTIVYGYLTLSLATRLLDEVLTVEDAGLVLNYGSNRVRYPAPVPVGTPLRAAVTLVAVEPIPGGVQAVFRLAFEVEGQAKPGCVADIVYRYYDDFPGGK